MVSTRSICKELTLTLGVEVGWIFRSVSHHDEAECNDSVHNSYYVRLCYKHHVTATVDKARSTCVFESFN